MSVRPRLQTSTVRTPTSLLRRGTAALLGTLALVGGSVATSAPAGAQEGFTRISGAGSTWSQNALDQWRRNVAQNGQRIDYEGVGSSNGRNQFRNGTVDFAVSEIPYGLSDKGVVDQPPGRPFAYMPVVAGGTAFMYNLKIAGQRVTNVRLSGDTLAKMFTGVITSWDDPAVKADNPNLALPARKVVPVVRSDGSGTTAQFTTWLSKQHTGTWNDYCRRAGISTSPCGVTSNYPVIPGSGFTAQSGSLGVQGYVAQDRNEGTINYVEYSYARNAGYPVAKILNSAGFYTEPKASNVAVALQGAKINENASSPDYLTQDLTGVYNNTDKRGYPLSSYSYMIIPTDTANGFSNDKGRSLGAFANYFLCEGQRLADDLGYSPLPRNLVEAGIRQVRRIPGAGASTVDISKCNNPTFSASGANVLAQQAPQPPACDAKGTVQCGTGTGGATQETRVTVGQGPTRAQTGASGAAAGGAGAAGTGGAAAGAAGTTGTGGGTAAAPGTSLDAGAVVPGATGVTVDEDGVVVAAGTGQEVAGDAAASGGGFISATPVSLANDSGWGLSATLALLSVLALVLVVVAPPLLARSLRRDAA